MRIYISGALKGSRDLAAARALYEEVAAIIAASGHDPYLPHKTTDPVFASAFSAEAVFARDLNALRNCGAMVAILNEPSLGVGAELAICCYESIPTIGLYHAESDVSRFALGCLTAGGGKVSAYCTASDLQAVVIKFIDDVAQSMPRQSQLQLSQIGNLADRLPHAHFCQPIQTDDV